MFVNSDIIVSMEPITLMRKSIAAYSEKDLNVAAGKGPQTE